MATDQVGESRDVEALVHGERQVLEPPARRLGRAGSAVSRHRSTTGPHVRGSTPFYANGRREERLPRGERPLSEDRS
jgi:hypothetical protein